MEWDTNDKPILPTTNLVQSEFYINLMGEFGEVKSAFSTGFQPLFLNTVTETPTDNYTYQAMEAGAYSNLKDASGNPAAVVVVSADDINNNSPVFISYSAVANSWIKKTTKSTSSKQTYYPYDFICDPSGWVHSYNKISQDSVTIETTTNPNSYFEVDKNGWVRSGIDWKGRQIAAVIEANIIAPNIYDLIVDAKGNVKSFIKTWSATTTADKTITPDKWASNFSESVSVYRENLKHLAFPGICASKKGVIHTFFRKGSYHISDDGNCMYSYSLDFGTTYSAPVVALQGGDNVGGFFGDWRDCKAIRMSNGRVLLSQTKGYINGAETTYDYTKYKTYGVVYQELLSGVLDIANGQLIEIPKPVGADWVFGAGGLVEHKKTIYLTVYGSALNGDGLPLDSGGQPILNSCWMMKSTDFAQTWTEVGKISDGYNENSIAFIGDKMFCVARNAQNSGYGARIFLSDDIGLSWNQIRDLSTPVHGMYLFGLGDSIMIAGRMWDGQTHVVFMDVNGDFLNDYDIKFGGLIEGGYADITSFQNYIHVIGYASSNLVGEIFTKKIERSKLIGLSH